MSDERSYSIGELAEAAGVTPRTIRYYTGEGLLPKPDTRGQYAQYGGEHLLRLRLIARLKESYLPLSEIRAYLAPLSADEMRALLNEPSASAGPPPSSAADYIAQLLDSAPAAQLAEPPARYEHRGMQPMAILPGRELPPPAPAAPPAYGFVAPAPATAPLPAEAGRPESRLRRLLARRTTRPAAEAAPAEEQWRRVVIVPGVELHIRADSALRARAEQLITLARELFAGDS
jgi:DNA-binding transcriptional MerR regulator